MSKKRILSGIQPSGNFHIGNYLGALRQWVETQNEYDCYFCIVDLHAITVPQDPEALCKNTRELAAIYIAAGIDPEKATVFVQSHIPAHSELAWILTTQTPIGWLQRMTQFKDKSARMEDKGNEASIGAGLLNYPILMAADILLYDSDAVPVGDDQRQHLEFTRDLAQRFNHQYGEVFNIPEVMIPKAGARIMGLDNPNAKMSKSEDSDYHAVYVLDPPNRVKKKIMRAVTDSYGEIAFSNDPERAGVNNLLTIYQSITGQTQDEIEAYFSGEGYGTLKKAVVEVVNDLFATLQGRYNELMADPTYMDQLLQIGRERAEAVANDTLQRVQNAVGFLPRSQ